MLDLHALATKVGLSRFQVLRAFRKRYGLPPHAYQLCVRVARARDLLRAGQAPAEVAAECGFADQSHLGRHFKHMLGVTPAQYARARKAGRRQELDHLGGRPTQPLAVLSLSDR